MGDGALMAALKSFYGGPMGDAAPIGPIMALYGSYRSYNSHSTPIYNADFVSFIVGLYAFYMVAQRVMELLWQL